MCKQCKDFEKYNYCAICGDKLNTAGITIQHMVLSDNDYDKLVTLYNKKSVDGVIDSMKNYSKLKKYKSAYLTANNWLKSRCKDDEWGGIK